jgi:hypothetical protein
MAKVQLPRNIAEALESAKTNGGAEHVIYVLFSETNYYTGDAVVALNDFDKMTLVSALVNGYKVAESPEDRLRRCYESHKRSNFASDVRFAEGMERTLEIMGAEYPELAEVLDGDGE